MPYEDVELNESEYPLAIQIFSVLRWAMVGCLVLTFVAGVYLLFKGYPWYFVLLGYLIVNFGLRVLRTYFRNIADDLIAEQTEMGEKTF